MRIPFERWPLLAAFAALLSACAVHADDRPDNGIVIELEQRRATDPRLLKIEVLADDIIHVVAAPGDAFSTRPSLVVERTDWAPVDWLRVDDGRTTTITTPKLRVTVDRETGALTFYDANGDVLLREQAGGGKTITPAEVLGEQTYHVRQVFDAAPGEAFYGLGQHQNGLMNYRGHDVDLWQENMVAVVPFLVSSKRYGILWDNTSRTKFGDVREFQPLTHFKLVDRDGNPGGLTVEYFSDTTFQTLFATETRSEIAHDFVDAPGTFPEGFTKNGTSIRWTGAIEATETGNYKFRFYSSEYAKLWLNGALVQDTWRQNWLPWERVYEVPMEAGKRYPIRIDWVPNGGFIGLTALTPEPPGTDDQLSLWSEVGDQIDYYFIHGETMDEVIGGYREVTGKAPMMPKWALGLWQSRERYQTQDELLDVVRAFRERRIPLDNIVLDWRYWPDPAWGSHEFDTTRFPDPKGMIDTAHALNARFMISVWPKFNVGTEHYQEFADRGWLYMHNVEKGVKDWVGPGYVSTFYDPFSEGARELFWEQIDEHLFRLGIDAWWLDATEPDLESNVTAEARYLRINPNALGTSARYLNAYSLMNAKGIYEGQREAAPDQRVFILTRSAFAGQQRYAAATWSGDVATRWHDLAAQIPAGLNFSLSGIPYWTADIGGFAVEPRFVDAGGEDLEEWRELNTRWFQFGAFLPLFRVHGQFPYREMYNLAPEDHPAYQTMLAYARLRYRLMPYLYTLAGMVTHDDYTILRALVMDFPDDPNVLEIGDQYLLGPALLVNPVTAYKARSREVYLPAGTGWYAFRTGRHYAGGQTITADAPYSDIPIFIREGAIVPFGPPIQYSDEKPADPLRLYVYTGRDGAFTLYEDENVDYAYEQGAFSRIPFTYDEAAGTLTIGARQGSFPGMLQERTIEVVWVTPGQPAALDLEAPPAQTVRYDGREITVQR